ncbi:MAG: DegT/DnrJ/EryC1/StrS family aminotransferase [Fidelibacterota bacterium]|nr:MAG: DegT/DnrJ/EryC1/StrS family aminotransferase [Candidatus Neomarinimicrobiota bacterium]
MSQLAFHGGKPIRTRAFVEWPQFDENELKNLERVIRSRTWFAGMRGSDPGTRTAVFEEKFATYHDAQHGIACANGSAAIEIALRAAGIGAGDEVIVPALTFIATLSAVLQVNAIPVLVDTVYNTQCIDPEGIEKVITDRTKAIIPVHYGGHVCDMDRIVDLARKHNLVIIEDAAHAHGAVYKGRKVGALGDMATFSFQESKTMTSGEGGMITTNTSDLAERCIQYRSCGRHEGESWYIHHVLPLNYRLAEVLSAILLAQLERLDDQLKTKQASAGYLAEKFDTIEGINPVPGDGQTDVNGYYWYLLQYNPSEFAGISRDRFVEALNAEGIPSHIGYPWPLSRNPMFESIQEGARGCPYTCPYYEGKVDIRKKNFPVAERICQETVVIPHQVLLSPKSDLDYIIAAIKKIQAQARTLL